MTTPHDADDRLQGRLSSDQRGFARRRSEEDVERVWRAVSGDLPAAERRDVVDRMASQPRSPKRGVSRTSSDARRWGTRQLDAVRPPDRGRPPGLALRPCWSSPWASVWCSSAGHPQTPFATRAALSSSRCVASDATLPRDAFVLRWKPGPEARDTRSA